MKDFIVPPESTCVATAPQECATLPFKSAFSPTPSRDTIARRAYDIHVKKGRQHGHSQQDWHQAESELQWQAVMASPPAPNETHPVAPIGSEPVKMTLVRPAQYQEIDRALLKHSSAVGIFPSHDLAEKAIRELQLSGLDIKKLSIIGKEQYTDESVVGYYNLDERMQCWGKTGVFWGGLWGLLLGAGFFSIPGLGLLLVAGPLVSMIGGALEGAALLGGLSAVGAALYSMGIPKDSVIKYETAIKTGKYVLIFHGTTEEVKKTRQTLVLAKAEETALHEAEETTVIVCAL